MTNVLGNQRGALCSQAVSTKCSCGNGSGELKDKGAVGKGDPHLDDFRSQQRGSEEHVRATCLRVHTRLRVVCVPVCTLVCMYMWECASCV